MKIIFKKKDFVITPSIEIYVEKKMETLEKFFKSFGEEKRIIEVELGKVTARHKTGDIFRAEINLNLGGKMFRAESAREDLFTAIDETRDDLEQEIKKFKEKKETIFIRGARSIKKKFALSGLARFREK
ncbi:MAG: ribosome-associated translation inhibitor RaiA [Patescibacteria group bacterium]